MTAYLTALALFVCMKVGVPVSGFPAIPMFTAVTILGGSRTAYLNLGVSPDFQAALRQRIAALANQHMLHLDGSPYVE